jgi:hypothetical protein
MINPSSDIWQDSITGKKVIFPDSLRVRSDSVISPIPIHKRDSANYTSISTRKQIIAPYSSDSTSVCMRNSISDVTFYNSNNLITKIKQGTPDPFPHLFTEKNAQIQAAEKATLVKHLRQGNDLASQPLNEDWIIAIILIAALLFSLIRKTSKSIFSEIGRYFLLRGINEPSSRDAGGLFHWQSTILNLISFLIIGLFAYSAAAYYDYIPARLSGLLFWSVSFGIIISVVTLRHIVCIITGNFSGERDAFRDYLFSVYQFYRFSALFLFILILLMSYTYIGTARFYFITGIIVIGTLYLLRVIRLMIIFLNRNISIFYLILYLCGLEFLPVVVSVKYITGLV